MDWRSKRTGPSANRPPGSNAHGIPCNAVIVHSTGFLLGGKMARHHLLLHGVIAFHLQHLGIRVRRREARAAAEHSFRLMPRSGGTYASK